MEPLELDALTVPGATAVRPRFRPHNPDHSVLPEMLNRFAAGTAIRDERNIVVRHLLTGCRSCSQRLGHLWSLGDCL